MDETKVYREPGTGRFAYYGDFDRLCKCGHSLGVHIAGGFECGTDPTGNGASWLATARAVLEGAAAPPDPPPLVGIVKEALVRECRALFGSTWDEDSARRLAAATVAAVRGRLAALFDAALSDKKPNYDDSVTGFNEAWDLVRRELEDRRG